METDSYGSEDEFIGKTQNNGGSVHGMANGNGNVSWNKVRDVAQYLIYPIVAALFYLVVQNNSLDRRLAAMEQTVARPIVDIESVRQIAVIAERQNRNTVMIEELTRELAKHRELSTYDPTGPRRK
jgi:hypothetical protein